MARYRKHSAEKLRELFSERLTFKDILPKTSNWDATNPETLAEYLNDKTRWVVVVPTHVDMTTVPAIWLVSQGLAVPEDKWEELVDTRLWVFANAWRVALGCCHSFMNGAKDHPNLHSYKSDITAQEHLRKDHPTEYAGFRILRVHALSQKEAVLGAVRRAFMEMLHRTGSLSAVDSANAINHGATLESKVIHRQASVDAIDKAVLFIGTQCNWVKNPAFLRPDYLKLNPEGPDHYKLDSVWYDYATIRDFITEARPLIGVTTAGTGLYEVVDKYIGTMLFAWSMIHANALPTLSSSASNGSLGEIGSLPRLVSQHALLDEDMKHEFCYRLAPVKPQEGPLWAFTQFCGPVNYKVMDHGRIDTGSYYLFARTWRNEITPQAYRWLAKDKLPDLIKSLAESPSTVRQVSSIPAPSGLVPEAARAYLPLLYEKQNA